MYVWMLDVVLCEDSRLKTVDWWVFRIRI